MCPISISDDEVFDCFTSIETPTGAASLAFSRLTSGVNVTGVLLLVFPEPSLELLPGRSWPSLGFLRVSKMGSYRRLSTAAEFSFNMVNMANSRCDIVYVYCVLL